MAMMTLRPTGREIRLNRYKVQLEAEEERRRREDNVFEISKSGGEESGGEKSCNVVVNTERKRWRGEDNMVEIRRSRIERSEVSPAASPVGNKLEHLPAAGIAGIWSDDNILQLEATIQVRELLSVDDNPPVEEAIQSGFVPRFVEFLAREEFPQLQCEAAWALSNIVAEASEHTKVVVNHGAVPMFVKLLASPNDDVRWKAVLALGNVAGNSPKCRDLVLAQGALTPLLAHLNGLTKPFMLRTATWTLSNFVSGKPQPALDRIRPALPALWQLIHSGDQDVLSYACWALSYLSDGTNDKIQVVIEANVCPRLVELLNHPSPSVVIPAVRTVGNIVSGDDMQTQYIINLQALPRLLSLLINNTKKGIKKEVCWSISNITAGRKEQIQSVIDANLIGPLVQLLVRSKIDVKTEAAQAISNATSGGTHDQIKYLVSQGCIIKPLCDLLMCQYPKIVIACLEGLENILKVGEAKRSLVRPNPYAIMIMDAGGLEKMMNLQSHADKKVRKKAVKILGMYWVVKDDGAKPSGFVRRGVSLLFG